MSKMSNHYLSLLDIIVDWFECIRSPINSCVKILDSAISDKEKIKYTFRIWIAAFLLSFCLELPIYIYYGTHNEYVFYIIYIIIGFISFLISSYFIHVILKIFSIRSKYIETLICYTFLIVSYSPLLLLLLYHAIYYNMQILSAIKKEHIDIINNLSKLKEIIDKINHPSLLLLINNIENFFAIILQSVTSVLLSYLFIERYNCSKFKSLLAITCAQTTMIFPLLLPGFIRELILYTYLK